MPPPTPTPEAPDPGSETDVPEDEASFVQGQQGTLLAPRAGCIRGACGRDGCRLRPQTQLIHQRNVVRGDERRAMDRSELRRSFPL